MLTDQQISLCQPGIARLANPVLPLARLAGMLYLTGPFATLEDLLAELNEPVETAGISYEQPAALLRPYLDAMRPFERLKHPQQPSRLIVDANLQPAEQFTALDSWITQNILTQELEKINSLLCGPCGCTLCCTGPSTEQEQEFFEIPLTGSETDHFDLPRQDDEKTRAAAPDDEPPLVVNGAPFYANPAALYGWRKGWSMILPCRSRCPNLDADSGGCRIYPDRPDVCRRPQIFPYMLEQEPALDMEYEGRTLPAFVIRAKILAIWDCPYVQQFQDEIVRYAELCGLEPIFKQNKA
ncbi:MAG: YkgJ family cysteine cluster protein [Proteobacteria bacterium]|nr:YkgJ family cysteine cluster protein [Pseudomonadota bacterium]MBU0965406.1 YkgJ family cysteine cluster protein [Pseudomonadota bacterium]